MTVLLLGLITLLTSTLTGVFGVGGGMLLVGIMPFFLPAAAVIPVHGVTQLASNFSRAAFSYRYIEWSAVMPFLLGSVVGVVCFAALLHVISLTYIPLFIGSYILLLQWSEAFNQFIKRFESFMLVGFFQSGFGVIAGAPGPIAIALLSKRLDDKHAIIASSAALMSITHGLKIIAFIILGVKLWEYGDVMFAMIAGAVVGSFIGTKIRANVSNEKFAWVLKIILSILAAKMIVSVFF